MDKKKLEEYTELPMYKAIPDKKFDRTCRPRVTRENCMGPFEPAEGLTARNILENMTDEEKIRYICGCNVFCIRPVPRLGVPEVWTTDSTAGVRRWDVQNTVFPSGISLAATFDRNLIKECGRYVARECRYVGASVLLGPAVNIARIPTCGRNFEYMGEDPYLAGEMAGAYVTGIQSEDVIPTVKHFACNNSDYNRHKSNSIVDERTLREIYLRAFQKAVKAGAMGIMTSYNQINGVYGSENRHLVGDILRGEWGFDGFVVSDWISLYDTERPMHCGVDLEMPGLDWLGDVPNEDTWFTPEKIHKLLDEGKITMAEIESKVYSILKVLEKAGVFKRPVAEPEKGCGTPQAATVARKIGQEAVVLLKNEKLQSYKLQNYKLQSGKRTLPVDASGVKHIVLMGCNSNKVPTGGGGSAFVFSKDYVKSLPEALAESCPGSDVTLMPEMWFDDEKLRDQVRSADLVIFQTGYDNVQETEGRDRMYELPKDDAFGISCAARLNRDKLVVVVHAGGDFETKTWIDACPAVIDALYLGQETSDTLCDVIFGKVNPSGHLPFTIAKDMFDHLSERDCPADYDRFDYKNPGQGNPAVGTIEDVVYHEGLRVGYRRFDTDQMPVEFPFGHGLSYTSFEISGLKLRVSGESVVADFTVSNTGCIDGDAVPQLYIHDTESPVFKVEQELKGFERISIKAGSSADVQIVVPFEEFGRFDADAGKWVVDKDTYEIRLGFSSRDIRAVGNVRL